MPEFIDEEAFLKLVAERLNSGPGSGTRVDLDADTVEGSFGDVVLAVLDVYGEHGPVLFGD